MTVEVRDVAFSYGGRRDAESAAFGMHIDEFTVPPGSSTALVGASGSGKTTLLGLVAGTLRPTSGSINVVDRDITAASDAELADFRVRNIGQVFQAFELLAYLTVLENVMLPWFIAGGADRSKTRSRAAALLDSVGLESKSRARPGELSQGEQQRVAVCRAMLNSPPLLLADEPTGNLDQANKQNVVDLLIEQAKLHESTLLMVTHDESLLGSFDTVLDMRELAKKLL
jgi:putative ABC transport system ATP-binding protein